MGTELQITPKTPLALILEKQSLILYDIRKKLELCNYVQENQKAGNNLFFEEFINYTSLLAYRSVGIGLAALFTNRSADRNNFHKFYRNSDISEYIEPTVSISVATLLLGFAESCEVIQSLRDKEFAHYDFETGTVIKYNHKHLGLFNSMYSLAVSLHSMVANDTGVEYAGTRPDINDFITSLKRIEHLNL